MDKNKYYLIVESVLNGNWTYNANKIKHWSKKEVLNLLEFAEAIGDDIARDIKKLIKMSVES